MLDTLLKQSIAVLTATIMGALLVSVILISGLVLRPQIQRSAADTAQMIRDLELSISQMNPLQQYLFLEALRADGPSDILVAEAPPDDTGMPRSFFVSYFLRVLSTRHDISLSNVLVGSEGRLWVRIVTADEPHWISLRTLPSSDPLVGLLVAAMVALLAALAGGIALQRWIGRPLKRLEDAVARMASPTDTFEIDITHPREIAAVSRALTAMSGRLQAAESERALMLAGVSHDLRTPLTKLRLSLAIMKTADADLVAGAERNVIRIETMLGHFLDFARGFEAEETQEVSLRALMQQAIEACAAPKNVALDAPSDVVVRVKEEALLRALDNLLSNAIRYGRPPVALRAAIRDAQLVIEVRDGGPGIAPDTAQALMRPFARGNAARGGEGTGLGLAIVDQVVKAHGGDVVFELTEMFSVRIRIPV